MDRREFVRTGIGAFAGIGAAAALAACGGDDGVTDPGGGGGGGGGGNGGTGADHTIDVDDNFFSPASLTVQEGESVEWIHVGGNFHTITPDGHSEWERQGFPTGSDPFVHTFNSAGTYEYFCEPHVNEGMVGTITVEASSS